MVGEKQTAHSELGWICPRCRGRLLATSGGMHCPADGLFYARVDGIWRFLLPEREAYFKPFMEQYERVRQDEGWGTDTPDYYRALPFADLSRRHVDIWKIRARSFDTLLSDVLAPMAAGQEQGLKILDLGSGNGWLAYQLARRGHRVVAVDLLTNQKDGLGAHIHYDAAYVPVQTEFDRLPVDDKQVDLAIYNGSLHYATNYQHTLSEGLRVLRSQGQIVILDSPIYHDEASGKAMVLERQARFAKRYNLVKEPLASENYLTFTRLSDLSISLGLEWTYLKPRYGLRWASRLLLARLKGQREPATFMVVVGRRN